MTTTYKVTATRSGKWWSLETEGVPHALSQAKRLDQADAMIREAISIVLDVPEDSFDVQITPVLDDELAQEVHQVTTAREDLEERQEDVHRVRAFVV